MVCQFVQFGKHQLVALMQLVYEHTQKSVGKFDIIHAVYIETQSYLPYVEKLPRFRPNSPIYLGL